MSLIISTMFTAFPYGPNGSKRGIYLSVRSTTSDCLPFSYALPIVYTHVFVTRVRAYAWIRKRKRKSQLRYSNRQRRGARSQSQTVAISISRSRLPTYLYLAARTR